VNTQMFDTSRFRQHKTKQYNKKIKLIKLAQGGLVRAESEAGLLRLELHGVDTIKIISEVVFTANHLTDTDKQSSTGKYMNQVQLKNRIRQNPAKQNYTVSGSSYETRPGNEMDSFYNAPVATRARAS